jgi:tetratricopeptide (TPR) repeat protein
MRPPGGPVTHDVLLPVSVEVRQKEKHGGVARLHDPSKTLQISLGRRQVAKGCLGTQRPTAAPTVPPLKRFSELLARSGRTAAGFEDAPSGWTRERNHGVALPTSRDVRDNDRSQEFARLRDSLQELTDILALQRNRESAPCREKVPEEDPGWATARMKLGLAYAQRDDGDRSQNWEMAIAAFEDALSVLTRERDPEQWATARMNLGVAYRDRLVGDRSDNLKRAICAIEDSLSVWTRERNPEQWAAARMNLGIAYWECHAGDRQENQERAIRAFEDCLSVWTSGRDPEHWATIKSNLVCRL